MKVLPARSDLELIVPRASPLMLQKRCLIDNVTVINLYQHRQGAMKGILPCPSEKPEKASSEFRTFEDI